MHKEEPELVVLEDVPIARRWSMSRVEHRTIQVDEVICMAFGAWLVPSVGFGLSTFAT